MIYYQGYAVSFQEVPDEISLVILIGDCPHRCPGCHSPELWEASGKNLVEDLDKLIDEYQDAITCVCFMGEGQDFDDLCWCLERAKERGYKTCLYTGYTAHLGAIEAGVDYLKVGPYIEALGGLDSPTTNQRFYKVEPNGNLIDLTYKFKKER